MNAYNDPVMRAEKLNELKSADMDDLADFFEAICEQDERREIQFQRVNESLFAFQTDLKTATDFIRMLLRTLGG